MQTRGQISDFFYKFEQQIFSSCQLVTQTVPAWSSVLMYNLSQNLPMRGKLSDITVFHPYCLASYFSTDVWHAFPFPQPIA